MKYILVILFSAMTTSLNAETLAFPSFQIEIQDGWEYSIENGPGHDRGSVISFRHSDGVGVLKIQSYDTSAVVSQDTLRNMTNLEASTHLSWQDWGNYSGYQYSYAEGGSYYRQWWLTMNRSIMFITYQSDPESKDIETEEIDRIVRSITVNGA